MAEQIRKFTGSEACVLVVQEPKTRGVIIGAVITEANILTTRLCFGTDPSINDLDNGGKFDTQRAEELLDQITGKEVVTDEAIGRLSTEGRQLLWRFCFDSTRRYPDIAEVDAAADLVEAMFGRNLHDITLNPPPGSVVTTRSELM